MRDAKAGSASSAAFAYIEINCLIPSSSFAALALVVCPYLAPWSSVWCTEGPPALLTIVEVDSVPMMSTVEKVSAITFQVTNMQVSVQFYRDVLGMELIYGGEDSYFSSLRAKDAGSAILNLEKGDPGKHWGRLILYVTDVDASWTHLKERGFDPTRPQDGAWGERYFHMPDPDGHELSFARPLR